MGALSCLARWGECPRHTDFTLDLPSPGYRWPAAPTSNAATATSNGTAVVSRRFPEPMAVEAQGPRRSEHATPSRWGHSPRGGRRRGSSGHASVSSTPVARGPQLSRREGPGDSPGKSTEASASTNEVARPADYGPGSPRPGPVPAIAGSRAHRRAPPFQASCFFARCSSGWVAFCGV